MLSDGTLPGFLAIVGSTLQAPYTATVVNCGPVRLAYWGISSLTETEPLLALSGIMRTASGAVPPNELVERADSRPEGLMALLPPFALAKGNDSSVFMLADSMGFRQLYHTRRDGPGPDVMSTSALSVARAIDCGLDDTGVAVQSLLGWQLGQRTLFSGVSKLVPGSVATVSGDGISLTEPECMEEGEIELTNAVHEAADLLRESVAALLDEHPDAVLQLTGGQDSRLLLSAIPATRRRGLHAMTLGLPDSDDAKVAAAIAARYGLIHEVHGLSSLEQLSPADAWQIVRSAAIRLDTMSDPIATAALAVAESAFDQGVRISGLGGEVARGFYYVGRVRDKSYTRRDAERLASWRMFVNESVEPGLLTPEFDRWARGVANAEVYSALREGSSDWFRATDHLYLRHRMQRWAGVVDTAVAHQRIVVNPMLDPEFLRIASRLAPRSKAHSVFLARLQMELDPELGRLPLEGRPAPVTYADAGTWNGVNRTYALARGFGRKAIQRIRRANREPAGGHILAVRVVEHWRRHPEILTSDTILDKVASRWIHDVLVGRVEPRASSVAFLSNLIVASGQGMSP